MTDHELDHTLRAACIPAPIADDLEDLPRLVFAKLRSAPTRPTTRKIWLPRLVSVGALVCLCLLVGFIFGHRREPALATTSASLLENAKLIQETLALFPNQVRAIVQDEHGLKLMLAEQADVPSSPPLYVRICDGQRCSSLVTFSGQEVQIAGQKLTVLADGGGGIILEGNQSAWSSATRSYARSGLKIEARNLGQAAM